MKKISAIIAGLLIFSGCVADTPEILDVKQWIKKNRPSVLGWESFNSELVKTQRDKKVEGIGVIYGNFISSQYTDAALLSIDNGHLIFEIVHCGQHCSVVLKEDIQNGAPGIRFVHNGITYLSLVPKGTLVETTPAIEGENKHITLKHDAIEMITYEKAAVVWYWDEEKKLWDTVTTAD